MNRWYIPLKYFGVRGDPPPPTHYIKVRSEINNFKLSEVDLVDVLQGPPQAREHLAFPSLHYAENRQKYISLLFTNPKFKIFGRCAAESLNILIR